MAFWCALILCRFKSPDCPYAISHWSHLKSFRPSWTVRTCLIKSFETDQNVTQASLEFQNQALNVNGQMIKSYFSNLSLKFGLELFLEALRRWEQSKPRSSAQKTIWSKGSPALSSELVYLHRRLSELKKNHLHILVLTVWKKPHPLLLYLMMI